MLRRYLVCLLLVAGAAEAGTMDAVEGPRRERATGLELLAVTRWVEHKPTETIAGATDRCVVRCEVKGLLVEPGLLEGYFAFTLPYGTTPGRESERLDRWGHEPAKPPPEVLGPRDVCRA